MASTHWQEAIVAWANCLGFMDEQIHHVAELSDGKFFHCLLQLMTTGSDQNLLTTEIYPDQVCETLITFLKSEFPDYCMDSETSHIQDQIELTYISSLLLYFCSVKSNVSIVITKMCRKLSEPTQMKIKSFLEVILRDEQCITKCLLKTAIESTDGPDMNSSSDSISPRGLFYSNSPHLYEHTLTPKSKHPLRDFLQSPIASQRKLLDKRSKELLKVKSELTLEKFEKSDLQEELKLTQEKLKCLNENYNQILQEMKKLRLDSIAITEVVPHIGDKNKRRSFHEKRLKDDVKELETYISTLQNDLFTLQGEKETLLLKLSCAENHSAVWQARAEEYMPRCESLEQEIVRKEQELGCLIERCQELESHIQEMRKEGDVSIEWDYFDLTAPLSPGKVHGENLGQAVIDIKLQEREEENSELKQQIMCLQMEKDKMSESICDLKTRLEKAIAAYDFLKMECSKLEQKVTLLVDVHKHLEESRSNLNLANSEISTLSEKGISLEHQINEFQILLVCKDAVINDLNFCTNTLKSDVIDLKMKYSDANESLQTKIEQFELIQNKLQVSLNETQAAVNQNSEVNESLETVDANLGKSVQQLKEIVCDNLSGVFNEPVSTIPFHSNSVCSNVEIKVQELCNLLTELEVQHGQTVEKYFSLETTCKNQNEQIVQLCETVQNLEEKQEGNLTVKDKLEKCLQRADNNIHNLQHTVDEYSQRIEELTVIIEEKKVLIEELEDARQKLSDRDSKIYFLEDEGRHVEEKLQEAIQQLANVKNERDTLANYIATLTVENKLELDKLLELVELLQIKIKDLESERYTLSVALQDTQRELLEFTVTRDATIQNYICVSQEKDDCIISLRKEINILEDKVNTVENAQKESSRQLQSTKVELEILSNSKEELFSQYNCLQYKNKIRISLLEGELASLEKRVVDITGEKATTCEELQQVKNCILKIEEDKDDVTKLYTKLEHDSLVTMRNLSEEIIVLQTKLETQAGEKTLLTNELESVTANLSAVIQSKDSLLTAHKEKVHNYESQINQLKSQVSCLEATVLMLESKSVNAVEGLKSVRLELEEARESKEAVLKDLGCKVEQNEKTVSSLKSELNIIELNKTTLNLELQNATDKLSEMVVNKEELEASYRKQVRENETVIRTLTSQVTTLKSRITILEEDKSVAESNIQSLRSDLLEAKKYSEHLCEVNLKLKAHEDAAIIIKENEIKMLVQDRDTIDNELKVIKSEISAIQQSQASLILSHTQQIKKKSEHLVHLMESLTTMEQDRKHYEEENTSVCEDLKNAMCELDAIKSSKEELQQVKRWQEEALTTYLREICNKEEVIANLTSEITALNSNVETLKSECRGVNDELQSTLLRVLDLETNNENCLQTCKTVKEESEQSVLQIKSSLEENINALEDDKKIVTMELETTKSELFNARNSEISLLATYTKEIEDKECSIKMLLSKSENLESEIEILNHEKKEIKCKLETVRLELSDVHNKVILRARKNDTINHEATENYSALKKKQEETEYDKSSENTLAAEVDSLLTLQRNSLQNITERMDELVTERENICRLCKDLTANVLSLRVSIVNLMGEQEPSKLTEHITNSQSDPYKEVSELHVLYNCNSKIDSEIVEKDLNNSTSEISLDSSTVLNDQNPDFELQTIASTSKSVNVSVELSSGSKIVDEIKSTSAVVILEGLNTELLFVKAKMYKIFTLNEALKGKVIEADKQVNELDEKCSLLTKQRGVMVAKDDELNSNVHELDQIKMTLESNTYKNEASILKQEQLEAQNQALREMCEQLNNSVKNFEWQQKIESSKGCTTKVELDTLKQQNNELTERLQQSEMLQLKCEEEYWKLIKAKQETDIKLEGILGNKKEIEQKLFDLHSIGKFIDQKYNNLFSNLSITNKVAELKQKVDTAMLLLEDRNRKISDEILIIILSVLKWTEVCIERHCFMIGFDHKLQPVDEPNNSNGVKHSTDVEKCILIDYKNITELQIPTVQCQIDSMLIELESVLVNCHELSAACEAAALVYWNKPTSKPNSDWDPKNTLDGLHLEERAKLLTVLLNAGIHGAVKMQQTVSDLDCNDSPDCNNLLGESVSPKDFHTELAELQKQKSDLLKQNEALTHLLKASEKAKYELQKQFNSSKALNKSIVIEKESVLMQNRALEARVKEMEENNIGPNTKKITCNENKYRDEYRKLKEEHNNLLSKFSNVKNDSNDKEWLQEKSKLQLQYQTDLEKQLYGVRGHYEEKLEKLKAKMKLLYNDELAKMKQQHQSHAEQKDAKKYAEQVVNCQVDINELRSQIWELTEKLLKERKEKAQLVQQLTCQRKESKTSNGKKPKEETSSKQKLTEDQRNFQSRDVMDVIDESITYVRKRSIRKSVPTGMGEAFPAEDEEGEVFNTTYLADLKAGHCQPQGRGHKGRLSELQYRNSLCPPHLKSSYPAETQFHAPQEFKDDDLKLGFAVDIDHYDSLSTSCLIPGEKQRKKDRGQTSYKKPGPPTPGKNGGRLSLQGSDVGTPPRSVLREQNNTSASRKGATPSRLRSLFSSKSSRRDEWYSPSHFTVKPLNQRQGYRNLLRTCGYYSVMCACDQLLSQNTPVTPRSRRLTFFRKPSTSRNHPW